MQTLSATADLRVGTGWMPSRRALVIGALFVLTYVALSLATRYYMVRPFGITAWNPNAGFALALLLVFGWRFWPALAIATCIANLLIRGIPVYPYPQLLLPLTITIAYTAMAALLRGPLRLRLEFDRLRDVVALLGVATVGTLLVAVISVSVIQLSNVIPPADLNRTIMRSWTGHLLGIVINTPLLLMLANRRQFEDSLRKLPRLEIAAQLCVVIVALWVVLRSGWSDPYKQCYLLFLPLIWIAMRHGIFGATLGMAVTQLGLIALVVGSTLDNGMAITEFQLIMLALAVTGLFLGITVTENARARNALNVSEAQMRTIVATAPDGIITVGRQGLVAAVNPAAAKIFGCDASALIGKRVYEVLPEFESVAQTGEAGELTGVRCDGTRFPVELSVGVTESTAPGLRIAITRDITRRKALERQLSQAGRLAAAGEMAAALAHELHQPLSAIRNYAHATQALHGAAGSNELPAKIEHEAARAAEVVQRLRDFFRDGSSSFEYISVQQLVDGALAPMVPEAQKLGIRLAKRVACGNVNLLVDRVQLEAVIHCLVSNAFDSIAGGNPNEREVQVTATTLESGWVRLSIADSGPGISGEIADRLFEPFATTKVTGIGMGLAMSRAIVEGCEGKLWVEARTPSGAVFHLTLPPADQESDER